MCANRMQENHNPASAPGFFTSPQKPPFTKIVPGELLSDLDTHYEDGRLIPYFPDWKNPIDKERFPLVWENINSAHEYQRRKARGAAISEAERNRLVEGAKSPTGKKSTSKSLNDAHVKRFFSEKHRIWLASENWVRDQVSQRFADDPDRLKAELKRLDQGFENRVKSAPVDMPFEFSDSGRWYDIRQADLATGEIEPDTAVRSKQGGVGAYTVVTHREWSGEYRFRTQVEGSLSTPPLNEGDRITNELTLEGAQKIADSAHYMHLKHGGYRTFATLTFDEAARSRVEIRWSEGPCTEVEYSPCFRVVPVCVAQWLPEWAVYEWAAPKGKPWMDGPCTELKRRKDAFLPVATWLGYSEFVAPKGKPWMDGPCSEVRFVKKRFSVRPLVQWLNPEHDMTFGTVQQEVSRFMDALQKMKTRGWTGAKRYPWGEVTCYGKERIERITKTYPWGPVTCCDVVAVPVGEEPSPVIQFEGAMCSSQRYPWGEVQCVAEEDEAGEWVLEPFKYKRKPVGYCWVVENPVNERGVRNPHVHMLMDWRVKYHEFNAWAHRLERIWGQGYLHLEKIKESEKAGAYIAKAAGYLSKAAGEEHDQGPVRGNRYGIGAFSRAPLWCCVGRYELGIMGHLIADVHDYFSHLYGKDFAKRRQIKEQLETTPKEKRGLRRAIGYRLEKVRDKLNALPAVASKFQLLVKSRDHAREFWHWAAGKKESAEWLPEKPKADSWSPDAPRPEGRWYHEFMKSMWCRRSGRRWLGITPRIYQKFFNEEPPPDDRPEKSGFWRDWFNYESLGVMQC